jgi:gluconate 2-dehydrogenase gamma chain
MTSEAMMKSDETSGASGSMNRRDLLRAAVAAPTVALIQLAPGVVRSATAGTPATASGYEPKVFDPHQWKTVHVLSDLILPADGESGSATQAGVPAFVDDWLSIHEDLVKTEVLGGLTWIDMECNRQFSHDFIDCSEAQQKQVLDRIAYPAKAAAEDSGAVASFNHIRDLVLGGYYSSEMGIKELQYQGNKMLESWDGCPDSAISQLGVDYSHWEHWKS